MKVVSIVGARPQFIKAAAISRVLREQHTEILVHTGQHYDYGMSQVFFDELAIPLPDINLAIGSGTHGAQTGTMLAEIEKVLLMETPDYLLVYGDTNSTLAGALAAAKLHVPVAHVEAGLRSFNRAMPEEVNRVLTDHVSTLLFCPSQTAVGHLTHEGITRGVHLVGDVMADALHFTVARGRERSSILQTLDLSVGGYLLATVHRAENTDNPKRLDALLRAFAAIEETIIFPTHPRTRKQIEAAGWEPPAHVSMIEPVGYLDMVQLEQSARLILTDSGGIQKEAYWLGVPCITLRDETEWVETVEAGWNVVVGSDTTRIVQTVQSFVVPAERPVLYGGGQAAERCVTILAQFQQ